MLENIEDKIERIKKSKGERKDQLQKILLDESYSKEEKKKILDFAVGLGDELPKDNFGFFESLGQGLSIGAKGVVKGVAGSLEETLGVGGDTRRQYEFDIKQESNQATQDEAFDSLAGFGRALGEGASSSVPSMVASAATAYLTGGASLIPQLLAVGGTYSLQTYGDEVKGFREKLGGQYSEAEIQGMAFLSTAVGGMFEATLGNAPLAGRFVKGFAGKAVEGAVQNAVKKHGAKAVADALAHISVAVGRNALEEGVTEAAQSITPDVITNWFDKNGEATKAVEDILGDAYTAFKQALPAGMVFGGAEGMQTQFSKNRRVGNEGSKEAEVSPTPTEESAVPVIEDEYAKHNERLKRHYDVAELSPEEKSDIATRHNVIFDSQIRKLESAQASEEDEAKQKEYQASIDELNAQKISGEDITVITPKSKVAKTFNVISKALGFDTVYYSPNNAKADVMNAFVDRNSGKMYMNASKLADNPIVSLGHEFGHWLRHEDAELWGKFNGVLNSLVSDNDKKGYLTYIGKDYGVTESDLETNAQAQDEVNEEFNSIAWGNLFGDKKFLKDVIGRMTEETGTPTIGKKFVRMLNKVIDTIRNIVGNDTLGLKFVKELEGARQTAIDVMVEYRKNKRAGKYKKGNSANTETQVVNDNVAEDESKYKSKPISTPQGGMKVNVHYEVVDDNDIITSNDARFTGNQNRDLDTPSSKEKIVDIATNLEPERLMESPTSDVGAMILLNDGSVQVGNHRMLAIRSATPAVRAKYEKAVRAYAQENGIEIGENVKHPVLVRKIDDKLSSAKLKDFSDYSNMSNVRELSTAEQATQDASVFKKNPKLLNAFAPSESGEILTAGNNDFLQGFVRETGATSLVNKDGSFNKEKIESRVRNALLGYVFGGKGEHNSRLDMFIERASDEGVKRQVAGLAKALPRMITLAKHNPKYNYMADLKEALEAWSDFLISDSMNLDDYLGTSDMFEGSVQDKVSKQAETFLRVLDSSRSAKSVFEYFNRVAEISEKQDANPEDDIFGDSKPYSKSEVADIAYSERLNKDVKQSLSIRRQEAEQVLSEVKKLSHSERAVGDTEVDRLLREEEDVKFSVNNKNLVSVHNVSEEKLRDSLELGGLPAISVAIVDAEKSDYTKYGDISLIGDKELVNPKRARQSVYDADVYSSRRPLTRIEYSKSDLSKIEEMFKPYEGKEYSETVENVVDNYYGNDDLMEHVRTSILAFNMYVKTHGLENESDSWWKVQGSEAYKTWWDNEVVRKLNLKPEKKMYGGMTNMGDIRWYPLTLERVVKEMSKEVRNGEGFFYGIGNIRAQAANKFSSLKGIENARDRIVSEEQMEKVKSEIESDFAELEAEMKESTASGYDESMFSNANAESLVYMIKGGRENIEYLNKRYKGNKELFGKMCDFIMKLASLPTEYFEAKFQRAVGLEEFKAAVVPEGVSEDIVKALTDAGLKVVTYDKSVEGARKKAFQDVTREEDVRFSIGGKRRAEYIKALQKSRSDINEEQANAFVDYLDTFGEDTKKQKATLAWFAKGTIIVPEDMYKVEQALKVAEKAKVDPLSYTSPMELIEAHNNVEIKDARRNPDTVSTLRNKQDLGNGITVYEVDESEESRQNMREIINTHFGKDCSPWCLLQGDENGKLTKDSKGYWKNYNKYPKRVAFNDGKLTAFFASDDEPTWWDRQDSPHDGIPIIKKMDDGSGRVATYVYNEETRSYGEPLKIHKGDMKNGLYEEWYDKDHIYAREHYTDSKEDGLFEYWTKSGSIIGRENYKNGKLDGLNESWHPNGNISIRANYKDGFKVGIYQTWMPNGTPIVTKVFENGNLIKAEEYYSSGKLMSVASYKNGKLDGVFERYYNNGTIALRGKYKEGKRDGVFERFRYNGQREETETYKDDILDGLYERFHDNGTLSSRAFYKNGFQDGTLEQWDENGDFNAKASMIRREKYVQRNQIVEEGELRDFYQSESERYESMPETYEEQAKVWGEMLKKYGGIRAVWNSILDGSIHDKVKEGDRTGIVIIGLMKAVINSPEFKEEFESNKGSKVVKDTFDTFRRNASEVGRALNAFKNDKNITIDEQGNFVYKQDANGFTDKIYEYWINSILSGVLTHVRNISGNLMNATYEFIPKRMTESMVNLLTRKKNGARFDDYRVMWNAANMKEAWNRAKSAFINERQTSGVAKMTENAKAINGKFGKFVRIPTRFLMAADEFAKELIVPMEAAAHANMLARQKGLKGDDARKFIKEQMNKKGSESRVFAIKKSLEYTFQNKSGAITSAFSNLINKIPTGRYIVPFIKTPSNLLRQGVRKSPFGIVNLIHKTPKVITGQITYNEYVKYVAEQLIAWGTVVALANSIDDDDPWITGTHKKYGSPENQFKARNYPPYSIRIGGKWYSYKYIEPISTSLALTVDSIHAYREAKNAKDLGTAATTMLRSWHLVAEKSYFAGLKQITEMVENPEYEVVRFIPNFVASWVPNAYRQTVQAFNDNIVDHKERDKAKGTLESMFGTAMELSGFEAGVPKVDVFGREIKKDVDTLVYPPAWRLLNPLVSQPADNQTKTEKLIWNYNKNNPDSEYWPAMYKPTSKRGDKKYYLDNEGYMKFTKEVGKKILSDYESEIRKGKLNYRNPTDKDIELMKSIRTKRVKQGWDIAIKRKVAKEY